MIMYLLVGFARIISTFDFINLQNEPYEDILFGVFADHADMFRTRDDRLLRDMSRSQQPGSRFARRVGIRIRTRIVADNACDSARNVNYRNFPARIRYR